MVVLFAHDVYRGLVQDAGWTVPSYKAWLFTTLVQQLLGQRQVSATDLRGLSFSALIEPD